MKARWDLQNKCIIREVAGGATIQRKINVIAENCIGWPTQCFHKRLVKTTCYSLREKVSYYDTFECEPDEDVHDTSEVATDIIDE